MRQIIIGMVLAGAMAAQQTGRPVIRSTTQEVLLDLVVRDRKGSLIRDLKPSEVEVYDDGVRQKITGFRLVSGSEELALESPALAEGAVRRLDPMRQLRLVSLVYEGLDNEARRLARRASEDFLKDGLEQNVYLSVFVIGEQLNVLQPFTNDLRLLKKAVERATTARYPQFVAESQAIRTQLEEVEGQYASVSQKAATGGRDSGSAQRAAVIARMTLNMLNLEESLTRSQQSRSSVFSLLSLVKEQAVFPGRKTVIYFSRGLQVPENMLENFKAAIRSANRSGVSVYAVDARGLTLDSQNSSSVSMLQSAVLASREQQESDNGPVTPEQARVFDTAMNSIHANTQETLATLAGSTGGFLVANTNDFRRPLRRIHEEALTYYEVSYTPNIQEYDGKFHELSVSVSRPGVKVQSRNGYVALPPDQDPLFAYETPLFRALTASPPPDSLPHYAAAFRLDERGPRTEHALVIEVPLNNVKAVEDHANHRFRARLAFLALFKNMRGDIVERFSRDVPLEAPSGGMERFRHANFLQTYPVKLAPGKYTLETAVMDREALTASARRISVMVPKPRPGIHISTMSLVRRVDQRPDEAGAAEPLHVEGRRIVPTLEDAVPIAPGGAISFYFVVYPSPLIEAKPKLTLELSRNGLPVARTTPGLPEAGEDGRIQYLAFIPIGDYEEGQYILRAVVRQEESTAQGRLIFNLTK